MSFLRFGTAEYEDECASFKRNAVYDSEEPVGETVCGIEWLPQWGIGQSHVLGCKCCQKRHRGDRAGGGRHGRELSRSCGYFDRHGLEICGGAGPGRNAGTSAIDPVQETHEAKA